jgi:sugar/nucleoside kinase (ribokinase family)
LKVTVIGTINLDTILSPEGERKSPEGLLGGILYSVITIASIAKDIEVVPVAWIGEDYYTDVMELLSSYSNIDSRGIQSNLKGTNENLIQYTSEEERKEKLLQRVPPISFDMISPYLDSDLLLINLISGFDLTLNTLQDIKKKSEGLIYVDIHSLTLGVDSEGNRFPREIKNWIDWVSLSDLFQANAREVSHLLSRDFGNRESYDEAGFLLLDHGPRVAMFTFGGDGISVFYRKGGVKVSVSLSDKKRKVKDSTGCGDVFGGGFVVSYLKDRDPIEAAQFANRLAGQFTQFIGIEGLRQLKA